MNINTKPDKEDLQAEVQEGTFLKICWIYLTYPCGKEPTENDYKEEALLDEIVLDETDWTNLLSI